MQLIIEKFTTKVLIKLLNYELKHISRNKSNDKLYLLRYKNNITKTWK